MADQAKTQFAEFLARYTPEIQRCARGALSKMRKLLPGAVELVYDNYNALVIGFGPTERASDAIFSLALYPRWVTLFFLQGAALEDPERLLKGAGKIVRHIVLNSPADLDEPAVRALLQRALLQRALLQRALLAQAKDRSAVPFEKKKGRMVIKSISPKQRPRRHNG